MLDIIAAMVLVQLGASMPKDRLRIGFVSPAFPSTSLVFELNELLGLVDSGAEIAVLSCRPMAHLKNEVLHSIALPLVPLARYPRLGGFLAGLAKASVTRPAALARTALRASIAVVQQPGRTLYHSAAWAIALSFYSEPVAASWDWIHADFAQGSATTAWHLAELLDRPFSLKAHAFDIHSSKPNAREHPDFFRRKLGAAALVLGVSDFGLHTILEQAGSPAHEPGRRFRVLRVCTRPADMVPLPPPDPTKRPVVAALGRLVPMKGFVHLVRAVAILRTKGLDVECAIWGDGPEMGSLRQEATAMGVSDLVRFGGRFSQDDLPSIFGEACALVVPSVIDAGGEMDGIPTVMYEAMAHGRPVIATRVSGLPEVIIEGVNGLVVSPGDDESLANAVQTLVSDPARMAAMGSAARQYVLQNHDHRKSARQFLDWIHGLTGFTHRKPTP